MTTLEFKLQVLFTEHCIPNYSYHITKKGEIFGFRFFQKQEEY